MARGNARGRNGGRSAGICVESGPLREWRGTAATDRSIRDPRRDPDDDAVRNMSHKKPSRDETLEAFTAAVGSMAKEYAAEHADVLNEFDERVDAVLRRARHQGQDLSERPDERNGI